jgi:hydroxymethylpyrimidine pyrophosphatase-like HAD family hydrolase
MESVYTLLLDLVVRGHQDLRDERENINSQKVKGILFAFTSGRVHQLFKDVWDLLEKFNFEVLLLGRIDVQSWENILNRLLESKNFENTLEIKDEVLPIS